jgi:hypothetical protein
MQLTGSAFESIRVVLLCCDGLYQRDLMRQRAVVLQVGDLRQASIRARVWRYRSLGRLYELLRVCCIRALKRARPRLKALHYVV